MTENDLSFIIRGAIFSVYRALGPGLLESVYEVALSYELSLRNLHIKRQVQMPVTYGDVVLDGSYRVDLLVNNLVLIEVKSVEQLLPVHHKQLITYLKLGGKKLGLLVNFNADNISEAIFRKVNGL